MISSNRQARILRNILDLCVSTSRYARSRQAYPNHDGKCLEKFFKLTLMIRPCISPCAAPDPGFL